MISKSSHRKRVVYLIYVVFVLGIAVALSELLARQIWKGKYLDWLETSVNRFGYIDRKVGVERYRPGYQRTVAEILSELQCSGKTLSYELMRSYARSYRLAPIMVAFRINRFGLKGPEISLKPAPGVVRIMNIGDSCTFGPHIDTLSYPRQLERLLNQTELARFEVINAGHMGYNLQQVWSNLDEWLMLEPHIVTIYMGWNRTILRADPRKNDCLYEKSALYRFYYHAIVNRADAGGVQNLFTGRFDMNSAELQDLDKKRFEVDLAWLKKIVDKIRSKSPWEKVGLVTLAGLYSTDSQPSVEDVRKGYAVAFTANLAAWALLSENYNKRLRRFAFQEGIHLFDLEKYADETFHPRGDFFSDSVHPTPLGHLKIAEFLSKSIVADLLEERLNGRKQ